MTIYGDNVNNDDYDNNVTGLAPYGICYGARPPAIRSTGLAPYGARLRRKAMRLPCSSFLAPSKGLK